MLLWCVSLLFFVDSLTDQSAIIILIFHSLGCLWYLRQRSNKSKFLRNDGPLVGNCKDIREASCCVAGKSAATYGWLRGLLWQRFALGPPMAKLRHLLNVISLNSSLFYNFFKISYRKSTGLPGWEAFPNLSSNSTLAYV